tara:strand:+ start:352 stop:474 length:123 start_codon:yes stop_codon:yes gene_type:complete
MVGGGVDKYTNNNPTAKLHIKTGKDINLVNIYIYILIKNY